MHAELLTSHPSRGYPLAMPELDFRARRDLLGRRMAREATRKAVRIGCLMATDGLALACTLLFIHALDQAAASALQGAFYALWAILVICQVGLDTYGGWATRRSLGRIASAALVASAVMVGLNGVFPMHIEVMTLGALMATLPLAVTLFRAAVEASLEGAYSFGIGRRRVLLIADRHRAEHVANESKLAGLPGIEMVGYLTRREEDDPGALGTLLNLGETIEAHSIDLVTVSSRVSGEELGRVIHECFLHGVNVSVAMTDLPISARRPRGMHVLGWPLIEAPFPVLHMAQLVAKRGLDILIALVMLLLLWPLLLGISIVVALDSPGPIFFRQNRPGLGGRPFGMLKFRTMRADAEAVLKADPVLYRRFLENDCKLPADMDPRITKVGNFLRRSSLDELPQLINVLFGDMTLVGPRPVVGPELNHYGTMGTTVLSVRPGITGYWQVHGRSSVAFPERAEMDLHYISNWSLALDLRLLALTVPAVCRQRGAY